MRKFGLQLVSPPSIEPVTLALAKSHLRVDFSTDDDYIASLISAAREFVERFTRRAIYSQTWEMSLDQFPCGGTFDVVAPYSRENFYGNYTEWTAISLPMPRVQSVNSITYTVNGVIVTVPATSYAVDTRSEPARIMPINGTGWPYPAAYTPGSIVISYTTGTYGDGVVTDTCPRSIIQAILLLIGHWYANREAVSSTPMTNVPLAVEALLNPYKVFGLVY